MSEPVYVGKLYPVRDAIKELIYAHYNMELCELEKCDDADDHRASIPVLQDKLDAVLRDAGYVRNAFTNADAFSSTRNMTQDLRLNVE